MNERRLNSTTDRVQRARRAFQAHTREMRQRSSNGTSQASSSGDSDTFLEFSRRSRPSVSHRARSSGQASSVTAGQFPTSRTLGILNRNRRDEDGSQLPMMILRAFHSLQSLSLTGKCKSAGWMHSNRIIHRIAIW